MPGYFDRKVSELWMAGYLLIKGVRPVLSTGGRPDE
jgi:hypothetical protein